MSKIINDAASAAASRYRAERPDLARKKQAMDEAQKKTNLANQQFKEIVEREKRFLTPERLQRAIFAAIDNDYGKSSYTTIKFFTFTTDLYNLLDTEDQSLIYKRHEGEFKNSVLKEFVQWIRKQGLIPNIGREVLKEDSDRYPTEVDIYLEGIIPQEVIVEARKQAGIERKAK